MTQVIIVGAGPAGATLALIFAQRGIRVKLIEASRNFRRVFRGEGLMPSGLDAIEQMGLSDLLESIPHRPLTAWEFLIDNRSLFR
ncbi:MAG: FAD-dependent monooxygenase, partial [Xenococcaceae cyanobacterium]